MRLLLAQAPFRDTFGYSMPPPGLLRLGGELLRQGWEVELEDLALRCAQGQLANGNLMCESAARMLLRRGTFDVIGLSVMGATLPAALAITKRLSELAPNVRLILGGPGLTGAHELVLERFPWLAALVCGEAERTLPELLQRFQQEQSLAGLAGIAWRDQQGTVHVEPARAQIADLGELADYAWDLLPPLLDYKRVSGESEGLTPIDSGRGCVFDCSFCTIGRYWERRSRPLPVARLVSEVMALENIDGALNAYLCHDIFAADRAHALAFCEAMIEAGPRPWECRARVDHLDHDLLLQMGRAGCYRVLLGIESGAASVRGLANKGQYAELDVLQVVRDCSAAGIRPILSLILGLPGEGPEELESSLALVARAALIADPLISLHLPNPQIGCDLHKTHGEHARPLENIPPDMAVGCGETGPERELIQAHPDLFSTWSLLPDEVQHLNHLAELSQELPPILTRFARTWELLRLARRTSHHGLFREWRASELEFVEFAKASAVGPVQDALKWECAIVGLDGAGSAPQAASHSDWVQSRAHVVQLEHDIVSIERLQQAPPGTAPARRATWIAVSSTKKGVASDCISPALGQLLEALEQPQHTETLEDTLPGVDRALKLLSERGLIERVPAPNESPKASHSAQLGNSPR